MCAKGLGWNVLAQLRNLEGSNVTAEVGKREEGPSGKARVGHARKPKDGVRPILLMFTNPRVSCLILSV